MTDTKRLRELVGFFLRDKWRDREFLSLILAACDELEAKGMRAPDAAEAALHEELSHGGPWLGAARGWAQRNIAHGDTLEWASREMVSVPFADLWELAEAVAEAAIIEERKARARETLDIRERWRLERENEQLRAALEQANRAAEELAQHKDRGRAAIAQTPWKGIETK